MSGEGFVFRPQLEDVSDWNGDLLHPDIRDDVGVGHIVRIQVSEHEPQGDGWVDTPYVRVDGVVGEILTGTVEDLGRVDAPDDIYPMGHGQRFEFSGLDVIEIPLEWPGNEGLAARAVRTATARTITGLLPPD